MEYSNLEVRSLVCHRDVPMAIIAMNSLLQCSRQPIDRIVFHDDGSLTKEDRQYLLSSVPRAEVLMRADADRKMEATLERYPACREFRQQSVMALKLIDTAVCAERDFAYVDGDILFFKPFKNMFVFPGNNKSIIYMRDNKDSYTLRPWHLLANSELTPALRVCAGLMYIRRSAYDVAEVEDLLKYPELKRLGPTEQTIWAILAKRHGAEYWSPKQIRMVSNNFMLSDVTIAGHFVSPARYLFEHFSCSIDPEGEPQKVTSKPALSYSPTNMLLTQFCNKIHNDLYRIKRRIGFVQKSSNSR